MKTINRQMTMFLGAIFLLPAGSVFAGERIVYERSGYGVSSRGYSDASYRRAGSRPTVRLEREIVMETRSFGSGHIQISYTRPVVRYRKIIERDYFDEIVIIERPAHRTVIVERPIHRTRRVIVKHPARALRKAVRHPARALRKVIKLLQKQRDHDRTIVIKNDRHRSRSHVVDRPKHRVRQARSSYDRGHDRGRRARIASFRR